MPEGVDKFFVQNYLTGTPLELIPTGPTFSAWYGVESGKVYDFIPAEANPYDTPPEINDGSADPVPPEASDPTEPEGGANSPGTEAPENPKGDSQNHGENKSDADKGSTEDNKMDGWNSSEFDKHKVVVTVVTVVLCVAALGLAVAILKKINEVFGD
jgi:hypothetical protein